MPASYPKLPRWKETKNWNSGLYLVEPCQATEHLKFLVISGCWSNIHTPGQPGFFFFFPIDNTANISIIVFKYVFYAFIHFHITDISESDV